MRRLVLVVALVGALLACGGTSGREPFCGETGAVLQPPLEHDLTVGAGVEEYRARLITVATLMNQLDDGDRATLQPKIAAVIEALDASLAGQGSGWTSVDLMETLWNWCGEDVGQGYNVQP